MEKTAVVINENDSVATATEDLQAGETVSMFKGEQEVVIAVNQPIPFGHKFAIKEVDFHEEVFKYGESIGRATQVIKMGDHVHVHNVESERGRGDWEQ